MTRRGDVGTGQSDGGALATEEPQPDLERLLDRARRLTPTEAKRLSQVTRELLKTSWRDQSAAVRDNTNTYTDPANAKAGTSAFSRALSLAIATVPTAKGTAIGAGLEAAIRGAGGDDRAVQGAMAAAYAIVAPELQTQTVTASLGDRQFSQSRVIQRGLDPEARRLLATPWHVAIEGGNPPPAANGDAPWWWRLSRLGFRVGLLVAVASLAVGLVGERGTTWSASSPAVIGLFAGFGIFIAAGFLALGGSRFGKR